MGYENIMKKYWKRIIIVIIVMIYIAMLVPQNRRRIFVVGFQKQYESLFLKLSEPPKQKLNSVLSDYLEQDIPNKYYLPEKGFNRVGSLEL